MNWDFNTFLLIDSSTFIMAILSQFAALGIVCSLLFHFIPNERYWFVMEGFVSLISIYLHEIMGDMYLLISLCYLLLPMVIKVCVQKFGEKTSTSTPHFQIVLLHTTLLFSLCAPGLLPAIVRTTNAYTQSPTVGTIDHVVVSPTGAISCSNQPNLFISLPHFCSIRKGFSNRGIHADFTFLHFPDATLELYARLPGMNHSPHVCENKTLIVSASTAYCDEFAYLYLRHTIQVPLFIQGQLHNRFPFSTQNLHAFQLNWNNKYASHEEHIIFNTVDFRRPSLIDNLYSFLGNVCSWFQATPFLSALEASETIS